MLVDQQNSHILPLRRECPECGLDRCVLCFVVHDQEVFLGVGGGGDVLVLNISLGILCRKQSL